MSVSQLLPALAAAWQSASRAEVLAAALGFLYVLLAIRQHRACWIAALASSAVYLYVFAADRLYMQAGLQAYYVAVALYGWWAWRGERAEGTLSVTRAGGRWQLAGLAAVLLASALSALGLARALESPAPVLDSLTTWGSVFATWLMARKKLDNWLWWVAIDALIVLLCWQQRLYLSTILYILYVGLAGVGWRSWYRGMRGTPQRTEAGA